MEPCDSLASFLGSCAWVEKKSLVHIVCTCAGFWGLLETSVKSVLYTNLSETCLLFLRERCLPLIMICVDNDKGAIKAINSSLTGIIHTSSVPAKSYGTCLMQSFLLKFTDCLERSYVELTSERYCF